MMIGLQKVMDRNKLTSTQTEFVNYVKSGYSVFRMQNAYRKVIVNRKVYSIDIIDKNVLDALPDLKII